jgi:hypothetical protein
MAMLTRVVDDALSGSKAQDDIIGVFLFGSALWSARPRDIDVLVVYRPGTDAAYRALAVRRVLRGPIKAALHLDPHIVLLNEREAAQTDFIRAERCATVWTPRPPSAAA